MTSVNVTTTNNTVSVTENGSSVVVETPITTTVTATTTGPQGPAGAQGLAGSNFSLEQSARVDKSIVYFDAASSRFRADASITQTTLTDGGNF